MSEPKCPTCGAERPKGWLKSIRKKQSQNIRKALAESDMTLGRPRFNIDDKVKQLRVEGMSIREIAWQLKVTVQPVKRVLSEAKIKGGSE